MGLDGRSARSRMNRRRRGRATQGIDLGLSDLGSVRI